MMKSKGTTFRGINKNRLIILLVGFSLLVIPLLLFSFLFDKYYKLTKDKTIVTLKQLIFQQTQKVKNDIDPLIYLKNEFYKIHSELIPNYPNEYINGYPDNDYITKIYNKDLLNKLLFLIKDRFNPIIITVGTNNLEKVYDYISPELLNQLGDNKNTFLDAKNYEDFNYIFDRYKSYFENSDEIYFSPYFDYLIKNKENKYEDYYDDLCNKYLSRYRTYISNHIPIFSDYFDKQLIYPITNFSLSINGIHGFYSIIIPQSHIDPLSIVKAVTTNKDIYNIELVDNKSLSIMKETPKGLEYRLNFTTVFLTQIKAFKRLRGIDRSELLNKQLKISVDFPKELLTLEKTNKSIKYLPFICFPILLFIYLIIFNNKIIPLSLTRKVILILFTIIFLPILGTFIFIKISSHNLELFINQNISKTLQNHLESHIFRDQENNLKFIALILQIKKRLANKKIYNNMPYLYNDILTKKEIFDWFTKWTNGLKVLSSNDTFLSFNDKGRNYGNQSENEKNTNKITEAQKTEDKYYKYLLKKYINNLSLLDQKSQKQVDDIKESFSLGVIEDYFPQELEEKYIAQESIPHRDFISGTKSNDLCLLSYAQDKERNNYLLYTKKTERNSDPFLYINSYQLKIDPFCFNPKNKFANIDIAIIFNDSSNRKRLVWPSIKSIKQDLRNLIDDSTINKDSISEITEIEKENIIKERLISDYNPFIIVGIAKSNNKPMIDFYINLIFIVLFLFAILLLVTLTDFMSIFIKKPVTIYQKAIENLEKNQYGTTINSFSKDEFNKITIAFNEMSIAIKQKEDLKRYVSDRLIKSVEKKDIVDSGKGKMELVTILSSDIRNFTGISEIYEPSEIVEMLNSYFTKMQLAITSNGGIIDKYIGDAIQAVFYDEDQVLRASKAALSMRKSLKELNEERKSKNLFTIENGIGIDTDNAITGTIGTAKGRKDFSVNGEVINRAANLEAKTKLTTSKILISKKSLDWIATQSSTARNDSSNSNIGSDNKTNHTTHQSHLVFKIFDNDSVELVDVRE